MVLEKTYDIALISSLSRLSKAALSLFASGFPSHNGLSNNNNNNNNLDLYSAFHGTQGGLGVKGLSEKKCFEVLFEHGQGWGRADVEW